MAQRRMFSMKIVDSDAFLDMAPSTQALYFHLAMRADDDGFVGNPKKIMRILGASDDEMKVLLTKRFVLPFENGVCVIKHWKIHNYIQNDRYTPTIYAEEKKLITTKENGAYTENVSKMDTQVRLGKDRLLSSSDELHEVRESEEKPERQSTAKYPHAFEVFALWGSNYPRSWKSLRDSRQREAAENLYVERGIQEIKDALEWYAAMEKRWGNDPYFPVVTSPYDLDSKWAKLEAFDKKHA